MKALFIGDIIGRPGRTAVKEILPEIQRKHTPDIIIANGENAAGGFGITPEIARELISLGIDVITSGNHIWDKKEIYGYLNEEPRILRPLNYPEGAPGKGAGLFSTAKGRAIGVINIEGRVFMNTIDCPFRAADKAIKELRDSTPVIIVDMHAETTSEKAAIALYLDGRVSALIGTHTHVQTSDERVLANGTGFITDAGMTGPVDSCIGVKKELVIQRFLAQTPVRFDVAIEGLEFQGVFLTIDEGTGKTLSIERIKKGYPTQKAVSR
ncbi:MAG: TIGR00282 family metallophosphoesterase [Deltaproteobacteria bacterium]|nr:TIGR00282 family metallophosphoesterase [Deltaproteobacteria bacterium]